MSRGPRRKAIARSGQVLATRRKVQVYGKSLTSFWDEIAFKGGLGKGCIVRKVGGIGDIIMILPTLRQLKLDFPRMHLTFAVDMKSTQNNNYYELVKNLPYIDAVIDARFVQRTKYDAVVDISAVCIRYERVELPVINRIDLFGKAVGLKKLRHKKPELIIEEEERAWARAKLEPYQGKKIVALHTASMEHKRSWPVEKYREIVEIASFDRPDIQFLIFDFNNPIRDWNRFENCLDLSQTTVREMMALIEQVDLFIGPDSGSMHIAGSLGTESVVQFGSIPAMARINYYPTHEALTASEVNCLPCWYRKCPYEVKCMRELSVEATYSRMEDRLAQAKQE